MDHAKDSECKPSPDERRTAGRATTLRRAVLSLQSGVGGLVQGTAVELSTDGLRVHTPLPQRRGDAVEVRLLPRAECPGEHELVLTGRVVWSAAQSGAPYAAGIRLDAASVPAQDIAARAEAEALLEEVRGALRARAAHGIEAVVEITRHAGQDTRTDAHAPRRIRRRWALLVLLLLLLLFGASYLSARWLVDARAVTGQEAVPLGDAPLLDAAQVNLQEAKLIEAQRHFERAAREGKTETVRLIGKLGVIEALRQRGQLNEARRLALALNTKAGDVPPAWRALAAQYALEVGSRGKMPVTPPVLYDALDLLLPGEMPPPTLPVTPAQENPPVDAQPAEAPVPPTSPEVPGAPVVPADRDAPVRLEVDKSDYVLSVYRGAQRLAQYPVGLGLDNSTPSGDFVIANKIRNPAWFNRGESVPPGDPRNPLGDQWMGLGDERGATSYGIHPTREQESIGQQRSRGCVRMRPADAAALFEICPRGTPVRIVE